MSEPDLGLGAVRNDRASSPELQTMMTWFWIFTKILRVRPALLEAVQSP